MSNYLDTTSNELANTLQTTSNIISTRITNTDAAMSNYLDTASNELANTLQTTSNIISTRITNTDAAMSNYLDTASNELANTLQTTSNIISDRISFTEFNTCNYILNTSNTISSRISDLNTDLVSQGIHNKYIVDNVYDNNMTITGKLTVSMLEVTDLDVVYESEGTTINSDLISYINNITSNTIDYRLLGLTNTIANLTARIIALENA
jgi:gas vesicle protein